jgi:hypothetical protein
MNNFYTSILRNLNNKLFSLENLTVKKAVFLKLNFQYIDIQYRKMSTTDAINLIEKSKKAAAFQAIDDNVNSVW